MTFADPLWFLLLLPLAGWFAYAWGRGGKAAASLPHPHLPLINLWTRTSFKEDKVLLLLKAAALLLMIAALARPQSVSKIKEPPKPVVDIMLCLDTSGSMAALDFGEQDRLDAAKKAAEEFILKRPLDRIGLVVFGGRAVTQCPLTLDHETLIEFLRGIPLNATQAEGTAVGTALALASSRLAESEAKTKIVVLLTDGRSNTGTIDPLTAAGAAGDLGIKIYAIGAAVPGGGLIPVEDPMFGKRLVRMTEDLDENTLLEIARLTNARYFRVTSAKRFREIYDEIDRMEKTKLDIASSDEFKDVYPPLLAIAFLLLGAEVLLKNTLWRTVP